MKQEPRKWEHSRQVAVTGLHSHRERSIDFGEETLLSK